MEVLTRKRKLILCPLEELRCQMRGTLEVKKLKIDDTLDRKFKPGLYLQTKAFLDRDFHDFPSIQEHVSHSVIFQKIEEGISKKVF